MYIEDTEQRGPGIENGSEWSNGMVHFDRTGPPRKVDHIFRNFSGWTEPIHSVLDRNFRKFWLNGSRPLISPCTRDYEHFINLCICKSYHPPTPGFQHLPFKAASPSTARCQVSYCLNFDISTQYLIAEMLCIE